MLCGVKLIFRVPHCLTGFSQVEVFILKFLDLRRPVRCSCFPLEKTLFELNFSARGTA